MTAAMTTAMDGGTATAMDDMTVRQQQQGWTARWRCDGNGRRDSDATATTATAIEGLTAMDSATATVAMDGVKATAMEGMTATQ